MIKNNWVYLLFAFAVVLFIVTRFTRKEKEEDTGSKIRISVNTFHTDIGWGYDVLTNDSVYIHQEFIPAIQGRKGFASEEEARKIANLVIRKIKHRDQFPEITIRELDSSGIKK
jgi:hypothetical protein